MKNFDFTYVIFVRNTGITDLKICLGETDEPPVSLQGKSSEQAKHILI